MCVIMIASKTRPTEEMVEKAFNHNKDGVGIAWREENENGDIEVVWKKGLMTLQEAQDVCAITPMPYVVHFRVASVGGVKQTLTHPFLVGVEASLDLEGRTTGGVLFHNGHWNGWSDKALDAAIHSNNKIPLGPDWSDTRAMAYMVHIYGVGFMDLLTTQKGVVLTPEKFNVFTGGGWDKINDVWCSNDYFWKGRNVSAGFNGSNTNHSSYSGNGNSQYRRFCSVGRCSNPPVTGTDICESCTKERVDNATKAVTASLSEVPDLVAVVTGGTKRPLARIFTLMEIERLHREKKLSKSQYKKYRKHEQVLGKGGNREVRAKQALTELSQKIAEALVAGGTV